MKTFFNILAVGILLTVPGVVSNYAQSDLCPDDLEACFEIYKKERVKDCGNQDRAVAIGKFIHEKWKDDEDNKELVAKIYQDALKIEKENSRCKDFDLFDESYKSKNWDNFFAISKKIINSPETSKGLALDVMLTIVDVGLNLAVSENDKFNNDTIMYSQMAIQNMEAGVVSENKKYGTFVPFGNKDNALGWANYTIGYILFARQGKTMPEKKAEALQYFYNAAKYGEKRNDTFIYTVIGDAYYEKALDNYAEYTKIVEDIKKAEEGEVKDKMIEDAKAKLGMARAYADLSMDAFGRAQKILVADPKSNPQFRASLNERLTELYKFRFNGKTEGQSQYINELTGRPMPDPRSSVTPVAVEDITTTTSPNLSASSVTTTPATTTRNTNGTVNGTKNKTKAPVKKTTPKRRGTR